MLVRGPSLAESMSQYLTDRIRAIDNIEVLTHTEIVVLYGSREMQLERVRWRNNMTGEETEKPVRHVFLFIGAEPATAWLKDSGIRAGQQELHSNRIGRSTRRSPIEQWTRPPAATGNQCSWRVRRRRRAVRVGQAGGRRNRRGGRRWSRATCCSRKRRCFNVRGAMNLREKRMHAGFGANDCNGLELGH